MFRVVSTLNEELYPFHSIHYIEVKYTEIDMMNVVIFLKATARGYDKIIHVKREYIPEFELISNQVEKTYNE